MPGFAQGFSRGFSHGTGLPRGGGHIFVDELARFAEATDDVRLAPIIERVARPIQVAVHGRAGIGRGTVASALSTAGVEVGTDADMDVVVIAEALKPEERALLQAGHKPTLTVLNKADLHGMEGGSGPMATAQRRATEFQAITGVPTVPMVGLLAAAVLDDELVAALRTLASVPADLTFVDAFSQCAHTVPGEVRARLLATLDRFGIAHCVLALTRGVDPASLPALLRRLSGIDAVLARLAATAAPVRYGRVRAALAELHMLAVNSDDERLSAFLTADDTVVSVMAAAIDVVQAAGLTLDHGPSTHLDRAVHWRRYGRGPVNALHRNCAADICRGSLRLHARSGQHSGGLR